MKLKILQLISISLGTILFLVNWVKYPQNFMTTNGIKNSDYLSQFYKSTFPGEYENSSFIFEGYGQLFFISLIILILGLSYVIIDKNISLQVKKIISIITLSILTLNIIYTLIFIISLKNRVSNYNSLVNSFGKENVNMNDFMSISFPPFIIILLFSFSLFIEFKNIQNNNSI
jgi:hypothetical protein